MCPAEAPIWWYELRDLLRAEFIRCMQEGRPFPETRRHLLDEVEDIVVRLEQAQHRRPGTMHHSTIPPRKK